MIITPEIEARFWPKVLVGGEDDCWEWLAHANKDGYGRFRVAGRMELAHRISFIIEHGRTPEDCILHTCDNPGCVNHAHLFEGTRADNNRDCVLKGRQDSRKSVLHADEIRAYWLSGTSQHELARQYGVSQSTIGRIVNRTRGYELV